MQQPTVFPVSLGGDRPEIAHAYLYSAPYYGRRSMGVIFTRGGEYLPEWWQSRSKLDIRVTPLTLDETLAPLIDIMRKHSRKLDDGPLEAQVEAEGVGHCGPPLEQDACPARIRFLPNGRLNRKNAALRLGISSSTMPSGPGWIRDRVITWSAAAPNTNRPISTPMQESI
jgi:hypothetical protein